VLQNASKEFLLVDVGIRVKLVSYSDLEHEGTGAPDGSEP
jgi:hypothetical protein